MMSITVRKLPIALATAALLSVASVSVVIAQSNAIVTPADTIKTRQQSLKDLGAAFKLIRDQSQSGAPDVAKIKVAAADVKKAADAIATWFPKGTGPEAGVKTAAKPEIWSDAAGFTTATNNFVEQAAKFNQIATSADAAAISAGIKPLGQTCGGCHDKFRIKES